MADGKERRRKSPEGREKKREGHDRGSDEEKHQLSPTKGASPFARAERASRSPGSQHTSSKSPSSSSRSSSKSPMRQMGTAVLDALKRTPSPRDLCCGTSSEKEEADPSRSSVRRKASSLSKASSPSSTYSPGPSAIPKKSCLRHRSPSPQHKSPGASSMPSDSLPTTGEHGMTPFRDADTEDAPGGSETHSSPQVTFKDIKEGIMPPDDTLFRMFRFRGEVRERIPVCEAEGLVEPAPPPPPPSTPSQVEATEDSIVADVHQLPHTQQSSGATLPDLPERVEQIETDHSE
ncbi:hypothetical protein HPB51_015223 [Rhipicephalus microplus]|uniref:Uncharacterized protein n=1 Tax=Rhipicephalus microplus TaxID=6941 RepID=A0A9J6EB09_RHIMP|nr:WAS/WASL-interacting protein family member 1-like [Rhipicephalus microplus]KAH8031288.1 hypothetical protein HPB51_015223 [Rhipicephalus microplus]